MIGNYPSPASTSSPSTACAVLRRDCAARRLPPFASPPPLARYFAGTSKGRGGVSTNRVIAARSAVITLFVEKQLGKGCNLSILMMLFILTACVGGKTTSISEKEQVPAIPTLEITPYPESPLRESIRAAGDYLVRNQLSNGQLAYQVDIETHIRAASPSYVRLIAATGALFTACRVTAEVNYCQAGDRALEYYLIRLVEDTERFEGVCFSEEGDCSLGGSALAIDAIYKRWQATGNYSLGSRDLKSDAENLGRFLIWMRKPEGGFYHSFDPYYGGRVNPDYFVVYFNGESLMALLELYEMTGDKEWLTQAREINAHMLTQQVNEDHWHAYALRLFARLDELSQEDVTYAIRIGEAVISGETLSLDPSNSSISTATKVEATAALGQALYLAEYPYEWLEPEMAKFAGFVMARQLPENDCGWITSTEMEFNYAGGIYRDCEETTIRIDALQHWINGAAAYMEYIGMVK